MDDDGPARPAASSPLRGVGDRVGGLVPGIADAAAGLAGAVGGGVLAVTFGVTAKLRRDRALHPIGVVGAGVVQGLDTSAGALAPFVAGRTTEVTVRWSRATGLPHGWPDIEGLAISGADGDLLLASTGSSPLGRLVLRVRAERDHGLLTTLLPVVDEASGRLVQFAADPDPGPQGGDDVPRLPGAYRLSWAPVRGGWRTVARLEVRWSDEDTPQRFDPVRRPWRGTRTPGWLAMLREPAYWSSRRQRAHSGR